MTTALILTMILVAFVAARLFKSTKMWWAYLLAISVGLLMGMLSSNIVDETKSSTMCTQTISTVDNLLESTDMQSLVATVTEGTTVAILGLQVICKDSNNKLSDALIVQHPLRGRDSPGINDSS